MPAEADPLAKSEVEVIRRWIEAGAGNDSGDPDAVLSTILPMKEHPAAPASYPRPLPVTALVFADQGRELVSGGYHELLVWDARSGELRRRIGNNGQRTYDLALSPDGKLLAAATGAPGQAGEVRVFETASGAVVATPFRGDDVMLAVAFDHRGERLAFGGTSGDLNVVSTANWEKQVTVTAHSDWLNALAWNAEGNRIATASRDRTGKVFEIGAEGKRLVTFSGHSDPVRGVAFHPNGNEVISCDDSGLVVRWKIGDGKKSGDLASLDGPSLRLTRGEAGYFVGSGGGKAVQFRLEDQNRVRDLQSGGDSAALVTALAMHGELLALGEADGRVTLLDWASSEPRNTFVVMPK